MSAYNILDAGGFFTLAEIGALDLLHVDGRKVVITDEVRTEIRNSTQYRGIFDAWEQANPSSIFHVANAYDGLTDEERRRYNPRGAGARLDSGDVSIVKFMEERARTDPGADFHLVTDDMAAFGDGSAYRKGQTHFKPPANVRFTPSTPGFIHYLVANKSISADRAIQIYERLGRSVRVNGVRNPDPTRLPDGTIDPNSEYSIRPSITPEHRQPFPSREAITKFYDSSFIRHGDFDRAARRGFSITALSAASSILGPLGIIDDILTFTVVAAQAAELRAEGKISEANRLWAGYLFDFIGTAIGGAAGGFASGTLFQAAVRLLAGGPVSIWYNIAATVAGAVAGAIAGSMTGRQIGEYLYDTHPDIFDSYINPIYDALTVLDGLDPYYSDLTSDEFVRRFTSAFGFSTDPASASEKRDLLMSTKWTELKGFGGEDVLVGWEPVEIYRGEAVDKTKREAERPDGYYNSSPGGRRIRAQHAARMAALNSALRLGLQAKALGAAPEGADPFEYFGGSDAALQMRHDLPREALVAEDSAAAVLADLAAARQLALLAQDMAAFGTRNGESPWQSRQQQHGHIDYFA